MVCGLMSNNPVYTVIDFETTGLNPETDRIIEVGLVQLTLDFREVNSFSTLVNPGVPLPPAIRSLTGLTDLDFVRNRAPFIRDVLPGLLSLLEGTAFIAHNASFDDSFFRAEQLRCGIQPLEYQILDTLSMARSLSLPVSNYKLATLAQYFDIDVQPDHRALSDARTTAEIFTKMMLSRRSRPVGGVR